MNELESKITINGVSFCIKSSGNTVVFEVIPDDSNKTVVRVTDENGKSTRQINYQELSIMFSGIEEVEAFQQALTMISTQLNQLTGGTTK